MELDNMKAALLQFCATCDKSANLQKALGMTQEALDAKAKLVVLPEVFTFRSARKNKALILQAAEKIPGPTTASFANLARTYKAHILLGSILEKARGNFVYNTSVLIDPSGRIKAKYRKMHLFKAYLSAKTIKEADIFLPGRRGAMATIDGFRVGLSICYDVRFSDLYQGYGQRGVDILFVPSCFTHQTGQGHWEVLLRARAIENLCYVLAPNQTGGPIRAYGHSMIVSPWGSIVAQASGTKPEIIYGILDHRPIETARSFLPGIVPMHNWEQI